MIHEMGWGEELPVGVCPEENSTGWILRTQRFRWYDFEKCKTQVWKQMMQRKMYKNTVPHDNYTIAVHIRRGDVAPCMLGPEGFQTRFTPNQHYLDVLDEYAPPNAIVKIFSETTTFEPFDVFRDRGYELSLSDPPKRHGGKWWRQTCS